MYFIQGHYQEITRYFYIYYRFKGFRLGRPMFRTINESKQSPESQTQQENFNLAGQL